MQASWPPETVAAGQFVTHTGGPELLQISCKYVACLRSMRPYYVSHAAPRQAASGARVVHNTVTGSFVTVDCGTIALMDIS